MPREDNECTYAALARGIERLAPGLGPARGISILYKPRQIADLHKRIIDGNNKHLAGLLQLGVVDVAGHVGAGASGAYTRPVNIVPPIRHRMYGSHAADD